MKMFFITALGLSLAFGATGMAQTSDSEPATRDDVMLYLRTMHSHDLMQKMMEVQSQSMQKLLQAQVLKDKGTIPPDFDVHMKKMMDDLLKNMPLDDITQAMIPAYQKHFTKGDIEAMNTFYASPVGQKVLQELPSVMQEGMESAMPIMSTYLGEWQKRMQKELKEMEKTAPKTEPGSPAQQ
jgi:hypothetical protein